MSMTLEEVLALPLMGSARVVAGHDHLDTPVRWVHVSEVPDVARFLGESALVLTHGLALETEAMRQQFVEEIHERHVAGLVVQLGWRFADLPREMITTAERLHLPLISLAAPTSFTDLTVEVHSRIVNRQFVALQQAERFAQTLMAILIEQRGLPAILRALGELVGRPVVFRPRDPVEPPLAHPEPLAADTALLSALAEPLATSPLDLDQRAGESLRLPAPHGAALRLSAQVAGAAWGDLYVLGQGEPASSLERMALDRALLAIACEAARLDGLELRWRSASGALVEQLVTSGTLTEETTRQAAALGLAVGGRWATALAVAVDGAPSGEPSPPHLERLARRALAEQGLGVLTWATPDRLVALATDPSRETLVARVSAAARSLRAALGRLLPGARVLVGAGTPSPRLEDLPRAYTEAQRVLRMLRFPGGLATSPFYHDGGVSSLLAAIPRDELAQFAARALQPLLQHDAEHGTELIHTLRVLLDGNLRIVECAQALSIGRQTLYNRLERIEQRLGYSLEAPEAHVRLALALRVHDLLGENGM